VRRGDPFSDVLTVGEGRPGDPYRYHVNPMMVAMFVDKETFEKACAALGAGNKK
jgi:hypothetical protein